MTSKFDKKCDFCGDVVETKKGIQKPFRVRNFGDDAKPSMKRVCSGCDSKFQNEYGKK
jgi:hypothetical protein